MFRSSGWPAQGKLAMLGKGFQMYNELLDAIEAGADRVLAPSHYQPLIEARQNTLEEKMRQYLTMMLKLYADEDFISENKSDRDGIQIKLRKMSRMYRFGLLISY